MLNLVVLIGNLAADPEIRTTPTGTKVAKMRLAVNDYWTNRATGEKEKRTHWIDLNAWDRLAVNAEKFLTRGQRVAIRGSLEYREWTGQDGVKRSRLEVRVREMVMLNPKETSTSAGNRSKSAQEMGSYNESSAPYSAKGKPKSIAHFDDNETDEQDFSSDFADADLPVQDDDIPF
ncbi:MAG: single-stranded DNA-binding protein [bacterium]